MTASRALLGAVLAALGVSLALPLASPVSDSRGSDELVYSQFGQLPFDQRGAVYEEPVNLQQAGVSSLAVPYHLDGPAASRVRVKVTDERGTVLLDEDRDLPPTPDPIAALLPLDNSYWAGQQSGWLRLPVTAPGNPSHLLLRLERADGGGGGFFFYSDPAAATSKSGLLQDPSLALVVETGYGALKPAVLKAPTYARRVASLAPPWLGGLLPVILLLLLLLGGGLAVILAALPLDSAAGAAPSKLEPQ